MAVLSKNLESLLIVGVGTSGCKIAQNMKNLGFSAKFCFASLKQSDLPENAPKLDWTIFNESSGFDYLAEMTADAEFVVAIGDVGGKSGSYLLPKIARLSRNEDRLITVFSLLPFAAEKWLEYKAGVCLSRLKKTRCGLVIIDKQQLLDAQSQEDVLDSVYNAMNEKIAYAMIALLSKPDEVLPVLSRGQSVLELAEAKSDFRISFSETINSAFRDDLRETDEVFVISSGNRPITLDDSETAAIAVRNMLSPQSKVHFMNYAVSNSSSCSVIAMLGHTEGYLKTRVYDPLESIFGNDWLDQEPELGINIPLDIDRID